MAKLRMLAPGLKPRDMRSIKPPPKTADPELLTDEHRKWRAAVIARADGRCQDPRHVGDPNGHRLIADHVVERRDDPSRALDLSNGLARCWSCHSRKTNEERAKRAARAPDLGL